MRILVPLEGCANVIEYLSVFSEKGGQKYVVVVVVMDGNPYRFMINETLLGFGF